MNNKVTQSLKPVLVKELQKNRTWFLVLGSILAILGFCATIFSYVSTIFSMVYFGVILLVTGMLEFYKALRVKKITSMFWTQMLLGFLLGGTGLFVIMNPLLNAITLTLLMAILFIVLGFIRIIFAFLNSTAHQLWVALNGLFSVILGVLILQGWPTSGLWVIGLFFGINVFLTGVTWIMLALSFKKQD